MRPGIATDSVHSGCRTVKKGILRFMVAAISVVLLGFFQPVAAGEPE